jgi:hypothetical protein
MTTASDNFFVPIAASVVSALVVFLLLCPSALAWFANAPHVAASHDIPDPLAASLSSFAFAVVAARYMADPGVQLGAVCLLATAAFSVAYHANPTDDSVGFDLVGATVSAVYVAHGLYPSWSWLPAATFGVVWWRVTMNLVPFYVFTGAVLVAIVVKAAQTRSAKLAGAVVAFVGGKLLAPWLGWHAVDHLLTAQAFYLLLGYLSASRKPLDFRNVWY